ncbi:MAG: hypothetical protein KAX33_03465 [Candidatus Lokiarchaeota archaeon]|nr:hypothetical protein [Candidatus Lokiarchaeota archaeon]
MNGENIKLIKDLLNLDDINEESVIKFLKYMKHTKEIKKSHEIISDHDPTRILAAAAIFMANKLPKEKNISDISIQKRFRELIRSLNIKL